MTGVQHWQGHALRADTLVDYAESLNIDVDRSGINYGLFSVCPDETFIWACAWVYDSTRDPNTVVHYPFLPGDFTAEDFEKGRDAVF